MFAWTYTIFVCRLTPNQKLVRKSLAASLYKWSSGGSATSLPSSTSSSSSPSSSGGVRQPQYRVAQRASLSWFSHAWLASNRRTLTDIPARGRKRTLSWDRTGKGRTPAAVKRRKTAANKIWIPSRLRVYRRRSSSSKGHCLGDGRQALQLQENPREAPTIPTSQSTKRMLARCEQVWHLVILRNNDHVTVM